MMSQYNPNLNQAVVDDHRRALVAAASRRRLARAPARGLRLFVPPANQVRRLSPQRTK